MLCSPQEKNSLPSVPSHCPCHSHGVPLLRFRLVNCRLWWWPSLSLLPLSAPMPLALPCTHSRSPAKVSPRLRLFLLCHPLMSWAEPRIHPWPHHSLHSSLTGHITQLHNSSEFRKPTAICSLAPASEILSLWEIYQRLPIAQDKLTVQTMAPKVLYHSPNHLSDLPPGLFGSHWPQDPCTCCSTSDAGFLLPLLPSGCSSNHDLILVSSQALHHKRPASPTESLSVWVLIPRAAWGIGNR